MPTLTRVISGEPEGLENEDGQQDSTIPILTNAQTESSGVDPPSRSGTLLLDPNLDSVMQNRIASQVRNDDPQEISSDGDIRSKFRH